jgi:hypothetical protein
MKGNTNTSDKTIVPENPKNDGLGKSLWELEISNNALKKEAKFLHCLTLKM